MLDHSPSRTHERPLARVRRSLGTPHRPSGLESDDLTLLHRHATRAPHLGRGREVRRSHPIPWPVRKNSDAADSSCRARGVARFGSLLRAPGRARTGQRDTGHHRHGCGQRGINPPRRRTGHQRANWFSHRCGVGRSSQPLHRGCRQPPSSEGRPGRCDHDGGRHRTEGLRRGRRACCRCPPRQCAQSTSPSSSDIATYGLR